MKKIRPAVLISTMMQALEKMKEHYPESYHQSLRDDIDKAIQSLERVRKSVTG